MNEPAWIDTIAAADADPELNELYARVRGPVSGQIDHVLMVHSLHPAAMAAHQDLYAAVMRGTATLRGAEREMIAYVVSQHNDCHY